MNAKIINPFVEATVDVTSSMAQLEVKIGQPTLKTDSMAQGDVTGFIKLESAEHKGSLAITFEQAALLLVYQKMLGETLTSIDDSALDLAGEITNMVCGGAKKRLSESGYDFELTHPSLITGEQHEVAHSGDGPVLTLPLELEQGKMFIEVHLSR